MKKQYDNKTIWQSVFSILALFLFILFATGSFGDFLFQIHLLTDVKVEKEPQENGDMKETEDHPNGLIRTYEGPQDKEQRWHGTILITYKPKEGAGYTEVVPMKHGKRHGLLVRTFNDGRPEETENYFNGINMDIKSKASSNTSFQVLQLKYPWLVAAYNIFEFDNEYIENYLDTLETILNSHEFIENEFDNYYSEAIDTLSETPYDSLITLDNRFLFLHGAHEMKNAEFRLAVIDRYRTNRSTFEVVENSYPNYLNFLNDAGVNDQDFEDFCSDFDDSLAMYDPLDPNDDFFVDSVDSRLYAVLISFTNTDESTIARAKFFIKEKRIISDLNHFSKQQFSLSELYAALQFKSTSSDVAEMVLSTIIFRLFDADLVRKVVHETYLANNGVSYLPQIATELSANNSSTSATLKAYIIDNGGDDITDRGIAWAIHHNPVTSDNKISSGAGNENFTVTLDGLSEGTTYFVRSYATNKVGIAYGNLVSFVAAAPSATQRVTADNKIKELSLFPNPASTSVTMKFYLETTEYIQLSLSNLNGQIVLEYQTGVLPAGANQVQLDLSNLADGVYICQLQNSETIVATQKLIIAQ